MTKRTSTSYVCTLDVNSVSDMQMLEVIRKTVKAANVFNPKQKRVVLRGRKPITKEVVRNYWTGKTRVSGYDWAGNVVGGLVNASKLDVYIYDRR